MAKRFVDPKVLEPTPEPVHHSFWWHVWDNKFLIVVGIVTALALSRACYLAVDDLTHPAISFSGYVDSISEEGVVTFSHVEGNTTQTQWNFGPYNDRIVPGNTYIVVMRGGPDRLDALYKWPVTYDPDADQRGG